MTYNPLTQNRKLTQRHYQPKSIEYSVEPSATNQWGTRRESQGEITKLRKAWLAETLATVSAKPNTEAKIVGGGSYAHVAEYTITDKTGRTRLRGTCQWCDCAQVVEDGVMVLHGYRRPGDGYTVGRCPAVGQPSLHTHKDITVKAHEQYAAETVERAAVLKKADAALKAFTAKHGDWQSGDYSFPDAHRFEIGKREFGKAREIDTVKYEAAIKAWRTEHPLSAKKRDLAEKLSDARQAHGFSESMRDHFAGLLKANIYGTPIPQEVV